MAAVPAALNISLFEHLQQHFGDRIKLLYCTKATLVHLSHTLEDLVLRERLPAILFTGFQESSHWREETERYRALAEVAQQVCIFAGGSAPSDSNEKQIHVQLQGDDPLRQEWFVCILSPRFSVVLCGQDRQVPTDQEATRQFATIWTLDPVIINDVLDRCEDVIEHYRPDRVAQIRAARQSFPPIAPDPELITDFTWSMITFEEQLHQSLMRTRALLEQQLKWQEDMTNLLIHDLRAPLQAILLNVQLARMSGPVNDDQADLLVMAETGTRQMSGIVQTMLDTTKLEYGQFPIHIQPIQVRDLLNSVSSQVHTLVQKSDLELHEFIAPDVSLLWGDVELIQRVLVNLLHNAIKFTPRLGKITMRATLHPDGKHVELSVRDTGRGIPQAEQARVFERLAQVSSDDRRQGTGLGLYFCRLAAEAHHGSIRVNSELGRGSTFTITLPLRPAVSAPFAA